MLVVFGFIGAIPKFEMNRYTSWPFTSTMCHIWSSATQIPDFLKPKSHSGETKIWKNHVFRLATSRKSKRQWQQKGKEKSTYKRKGVGRHQPAHPPKKETKRTKKKRRILIPSFRVPKQTNKQKSTNPPKEKPKKKGWFLENPWKYAVAFCRKAYLSLEFQALLKLPLQDRMGFGTPWLSELQVDPVDPVDLIGSKQKVECRHLDGSDWIKSIVVSGSPW